MEILWLGRGVLRRLKLRIRDSGRRVRGEEDGWGLVGTACIDSYSA